MELKYDKDYFIKKFEAIPGDRWIVNDFIDSEGRCCALGHCGVNHVVYTDEGRALVALLGRGEQINKINDNVHDKDYTWKVKVDPEAKTRILVALRTL